MSADRQKGVYRSRQMRRSIAIAVALGMSGFLIFDYVPQLSAIGTLLLAAATFYQGRAMGEWLGDRWFD